VHSRKAILAFCRLAHRTLSGADFFPSLAKPTVGALEPLAHRTVRCRFLSFFGEADRWRTGHCPVHTGQSGASSRPLARPRVSRGSRGRPLAHRTVRCTPDSPVNYSRTPLITSREQQVRLSQPGAPDTVRCTTGQSGAPRQS
jgi:hypothetical protein